MPVFVSRACAKAQAENKTTQRLRRHRAAGGNAISFSPNAVSAHLQIECRTGSSNTDDHDLFNRDKLDSSGSRSCISLLNPSFINIHVGEDDAIKDAAVPERGPGQGLACPGVSITSLLCLTPRRRQNIPAYAAGTGGIADRTGDTVESVMTALKEVQ